MRYAAAAPARTLQDHRTKKQFLQNSLPNASLPLIQRRIAKNRGKHQEMGEELLNAMKFHLLCILKIRTLKAKNTQQGTANML